MSLDKIYMACVGAALATAYSLMGAYDRGKERIRDSLFAVERKRSNSAFWVLMVVLVICTAMGFWMDTPIKYQGPALLVFFFSVYLYLRLPIRKLFVNENYISVFVIMVLYFSANMYWLVMGDIHDIRHSALDKIKKYEIAINNETGINGRALILLAKSSNHFFFYDKEKDRAYVIREQDVKLFKTIGKSSPTAKQ